MSSLATASPPDSQNESDQRKVDGHVSGIDQHVFERPLLEKGNDHEHRDRPTDPGQKSRDQAPLPVRLAIAEEERQSDEEVFTTETDHETGVLRPGQFLHLQGCSRRRPLLVHAKLKLSRGPLPSPSDAAHFRAEPFRLDNNRAGE